VPELIDMPSFGDSAGPLAGLSGDV